MTSYSTVEGLWLTRLQAMSQFTTANSTRGKWGIRNTGNSAQYAILKPGTYTRTWSAMTLREDTYQTIIQVWQRYKDDGTTMTNLEALVDAILAEMDKHINLGDAATVTYADIVAVREMQEILDAPGGGPIWLMVELVGETHVQTQITFT